jgi:pyridoxal biosynthesis lyase PdxS
VHKSAQYRFGWGDSKTLAEIAAEPGRGMSGDTNVNLPEEQQLQHRGV